MPHPYSVELNHVWKQFRRPHSPKKGETSTYFTQVKNRLFREKFWALQDINFKVKSGEAFGIIGPNGSGKSTMLKVLAGTMWPNKGKYTVHGRLAPFIELGAGFQPHLSGRENVFIYGAIMGMKRSEINAKYQTIVDFAEMEDFMETPYKFYSSGMGVRLAFATTIMMNPETLLVDEVLAVGDMLFRRKCREEMERFHEEKKTFLYVSHNMYEVKSMCDRVGLLVEGRMRFIGEPQEAIWIYEKEIQQKYIMQSAGEILLDVEGKGKDIFINSVRFDTPHSEDNLPVYHIGEEMKIDVDITSRIEARNVWISFAFWAGNGIRVLTCRSDFSGKELIVKRGLQTLHFRIPKNRLAPGSYQISLSIWEPKTEYPFDTHHRKFELLVRPKPGVLLLKYDYFIEDPEWVLE